MANSISLDAFVRGVKRLWPRATVWTKGDAAHQGSPSDHNNDDTAGSKPEQVDADSKPEIRAADVPTLGGVTMSMLDELRVRLTGRPTNQRRLRYVILRQTIWRKRNGWKAEHYSGEYHGHLHASIDAADDDNGAEWDMGPDPVAPQPIQKGDRELFLVHKVVNNVVTFALVGPNSAVTWKAGDTITTPDGPISGQDMANAYARSIGDSKLEQPAAWAALAMPKTVAQ